MNNAFYGQKTVPKATPIRAEVGQQGNYTLPLGCLVNYLTAITYSTQRLANFSQFKIFMNKFFRYWLLIILFLASASIAMAERPNPVASRVVGGNVLYYHTLHEAVSAVPAVNEAAELLPDEITLLADIILHAPLIIEDGKHIRLVPGDGDRTIMRGSDLLDYPVIWVSGENASLTLGKPGMENNFIIDGGYLTASEGSPPPVIAHAPLAAVSGPDSKLIMYDGVTLQNNCNAGDPLGTSIYELSAGVFIRTRDNLTDRLAEFIMRGGTIRGNVNDIQNLNKTGGGVKLSGFGLFTMEGGIIMDNSAAIAGGGVNLGSRASFKKTGGIIYGSNAPAGLRNTALEGLGSPAVFGHAVFVALIDNPAIQFRDDTVGENDNLSYFGHPSENGVFGEGEKWNNQQKALKRRLIIITVLVLVLSFFVFLLIRKKIKRKQIQTGVSNNELTAHEKKVYDLLLTDMSLKMIADTLNLTVGGVKSHCSKIYVKLNVKNRKGLLIR